MRQSQHPADIRISELADAVVAGFLEQQPACPDCGGWQLHETAEPGPLSCDVCGHISQPEYWHFTAGHATPDGRFCPGCGTPYRYAPDSEGVLDCAECGLWTTSVFWQVRNDLDYTAT